MIDCLPKDFTGKTVLEIGPGTGLVSVFAGLRGATKLFCSDINETAVKNTKFNLDKYSINSEVIISDVFENIPNIKFDTIIFNLPYHDGEPRNDLEKGVIDAGYSAMKNFFRDVKKYATEDTKLYIGFSRSGNIELFLKEVSNNNLVIEKMEERNIYDGMPRFIGSDFHYNCQVYTISMPKK